MWTKEPSPRVSDRDSPVSVDHRGHMEVAIGSTQVKRSSREQSASVGALLTLLCASARPNFDGDAVAFRWDAAARRLESACGWEGGRQLWEGDFNSWIAEHAGLLPALERGDDVSFAGRVLVPIASSGGRLEGILALSAERPIEGSTRLALRKICEPAAVILAVMRERDQAMETVATIASELTDPLIAARGFTRMALDDARTTCVGSPEYLSAALRNINRLGELAVGLQHAGIDA
jgi:signal transduction histidine kinase